MDLAPYVAELREQLALAAEAGGDDVQAMAERLAASLEAAARLALLDALSAAAAEITQEIAPGSVEVRLRGRDPEFVVATPTTAVLPAPEDEGPAYSTGDDAAMSRINVRLPQELKDRVEEAARAAGVSVNTWLVRSAAAALSRGPSTAGPVRMPARSRDRYTGWVR
jgi:hypothetical protein